MAVSVAEYATLTVPLDSDVVEMVTGGIACTVSVLLPFLPASVAEMVVVPAEAPVARPLALIVATAVLDEAQVTWLVRFCVLPSNTSPSR